jgi:ribosome biogenesis protein BMS1
MHLIGAGDFNMSELGVIPDPCPLPSTEKKNNLKKKDSLLYAPMSNVGAVSYDKDAVYIDIGSVNYTKKENLALTDKDTEAVSTDSDSESEDDDAPSNLLKNLQDIKSGVDEKMKNSSLRIFKSSKAVQGDQDGSESDSDEEIEEEEPKRMSLSAIEELAKPFRNRDMGGQGSDSEADSDDSDDDNSDEESDSEDDLSDSDQSDIGKDYDEEKDDAVEDNVDGIDNAEPSTALWKTNLAQRAAEAYMGRELGHINLQELIYGKATATFISDEDEEEEKEKEGNDSDSDDEFFKIRKPDSEKKSRSGRGVSQTDSQLLGEEDSSRMIGGERKKFDVSAWLEEGGDSLIESIRDQFVTGNWDKQPGGGDDGGEEFDDFEDLETGEKFGPNGEIDSGDDDSDDEMDTEGMTDVEIRELNAKKKANKKDNFNDEYDEEKKIKGIAADPNDETAESEYIDSMKRAKEARLKRNKEEFGEDGEGARIRHEGFRQGLYVRVRIDGVPCEFIDSFNPILPLILGGLTPQETNRGFVRCRFKKHRWHKRILKCNDPLILSVGWRRFQSIPVFSTEDQNGRHR